MSFFEEADQLILRDLGSSNGTYVNGKRVLGKQTLKPGDILTIGGVTLRVDLLGAAPKSAASATPQPAAKDTAELEALPVGDDDFQVEMEPDDEEFEVAIDDEPDHLDIIPLDDEPTPTKPSKAASPSASEQGPNTKPKARWNPRLPPNQPPNRNHQRRKMLSLSS